MGIWKPSTYKMVYTMSHIYLDLIKWHAHSLIFFRLMKLEMGESPT